MKVKVIKDCYYKDEYIKEGRIIDFKGDNLPSWATLADGIETKKDKKKEDKTGENKPETNTVVNPDGDKKEEEADSSNPDKKPEEQKTGEENTPEATPDELEYLDKLINEGIEKNIFIEDADKKTIKEQITEFEKALGK